MKKLSSLSIFFPSLNDAKTLPYLIVSASKIAKKISHKYEIIVINDGSSDDTAQTLKEMQKNLKFLRIITHRVNTGYGGAVIAGIKKAKYNYIFYTDGDGQYDINELPKLVKQIRKNIDVVNGYKKKRSDILIRRIVGSSYNTYVHKLYDLPIRDIDCDFRLIKSKLIKNLKLKSKSGAICLEMILKLKQANARFTEVEVNHYPRKYGHSQFFNFNNLYKSLKDYLKLFTKKRGGDFKTYLHLNSNKIKPFRFLISTKRNLSYLLLLLSKTLF